MTSTSRRAAAGLFALTLSAGPVMACEGGLASFRDLINQDERIFSYGRTPSDAEVGALARAGCDFDQRGASAALGEAGVSGADAMVAATVGEIRRIAEMGLSFGAEVAAEAARKPDRRARISATGETVGRACNGASKGGSASSGGEGASSAGNGGAGLAGLSEGGGGRSILAGGSIAWAKIAPPPVINIGLVFLVLIASYGFAFLARRAFEMAFHLIFRRKRCVIPAELRFGPYVAEGRVVVLGSRRARLTFEEIPDVDESWREEARNWEKSELIILGKGRNVRIVDLGEKVAIVEFAHPLSFRQQNGILAHSLARPCTIVDFGGYDQPVPHHHIPAHPRPVAKPA